MTDKLEHLKALVENNYFVGCPGDGTEFQFTAEVDWLIQQVERVHLLEKQVASERAHKLTYRKVAKRYQDEKSRYLETIKKAVAHFNQDEHMDGMAALRRAMEGFINE